MAETAAVQAGEKQGLKPNAIGFLDSVVIGLASTAPAYSLAAVIGSIVVAVGLQAPGALLLSFVPMFLIATAFLYMNRAIPNCGTTFAWATRTLGPYVGWIGGWAVCVTGILVIGSLADIGARYTFLFFSWDSAAGSKHAVTALAVAYIVVLTYICIRGIELSALLQRFLILGQVAALLLFAIVALYKVAFGDATAESIDPSASWFSPFAIDDYSALIAALLLGVFIYWGWESAVNLTEETEDSRRAPGLAAVTSTVLLLGTYLAVATAVVAFAGLAAVEAFDDDEAILGALGTDVLGTPWDSLLLLAIATSGIASTQTTIIPASRTAFSMARSGAYPSILARVHPRFRTPDVATVAVAALATLWYVPANYASENFFFDTLSALALMIAFYYALSGISALVHYRREIPKSVKNFVLIGVFPFAGAALLGVLFVEATRSLADPDASYTASEWLGFGPPLVIGYGFLLLGLVLLVLWRVFGNREFFDRPAFEAVDPAVARGEIRVAEREAL
jgi:amino acid transporter